MNTKWLKYLTFIVLFCGTVPMKSFAASVATADTSTLKVVINFEHVSITSEGLGSNPILKTTSRTKICEVPSTSEKTFIELLKLELKYCHKVVIFVNNKECEEDLAIRLCPKDVGSSSPIIIEAKTLICSGDVSVKDRALILSEYTDGSDAGEGKYTNDGCDAGEGTNDGFDAYESGR